MQTLSIRAMHDVAYERGEEFDPALLGDVPTMAAELALGEHAGLPIEGPSAYDRRRARDRERRAAAVPQWLEASDLAQSLLGLDGGRLVHGELV